MGLPGLRPGFGLGCGLGAVLSIRFTTSSRIFSASSSLRLSSSDEVTRVTVIGFVG